MSIDSTFFIGPKYNHHATHAGYQGFCKYVGVPIKSPVSIRFFKGYWGWKIDTLSTRLTSRRYYSVGLFLIELSAAVHMSIHRKSLYHAIYGDTDLWLLPKLRPLLKNCLVATFHEPPSNLEYLKIDESFLKHLDAVILVSNSQRGYFEKIFPSNRIFVVPHGIDTGFFCPAEAPENNTCITVGSHHRDFSLLKRAMDIVWRYKPNVRLVAVGTQREKDPNPQFEVSDSRIHFFDGITDEELRQAYRSARIAVLPLREATANNAMLEAMACGLPIVVTDVGGIGEYLGRKAGLLSSAGEPEEFARNIIRILDDSALAKAMSEGSRARALEYDFSVVARLTQRVYSEILRDNSQ